MSKDLLHYVNENESVSKTTGILEIPCSSVTISLFMASAISDRERIWNVVLKKG